MNEEDILRHKGVKATPNRILVARELLRAESPLSLSQLEERLSTVDKSSIFRVLNLFVEHDVVHIVEAVFPRFLFGILSGACRTFP